MAVEFDPQVLVTPSIARRWLDTMPDNQRGKKIGKITAYARDMLSGNWNSDTGETIKFDEDGRMVDGQNRMLAVMKAGVPIYFAVARGLPRKTAMLVLDTGAARSGADVLRIANATNTARTSSIIRWVILWDAKVFTGTGGTLRPTHSEIVARYEADSGMFDAAARRASDCQYRGLGTGAPAGVAHFLFSRIDTELAHQFFDQYVSGANLPNKSAVLVLRNRIAKQRIDRLTRPEQLALFVKAWNFWRKDQPTDTLLLPKGDLTNENFPQPK